MHLKIDYVAHVKEIININGNNNTNSGLKITVFLLKGEFCILVELHREWSAPAACAAGLFLAGANLNFLSTISRVTGH